MAALGSDGPDAEPPRHEWAPRASSTAAPAVLFALLASMPQPVAATVFLSQDEALALAFPDCEIERTTHFLTRDEQSRAAELAGVAVDSRLVARYVATCDGEPGGAAYFDVHRVRTLAETLMVAVDADGQVERIEVMSFLEPEEYIPRRSWYDLFLQQRLDPKLRLKRSIHAVSGATLTARATTDAVRRILALDQVLAESPP